MFALSLRELSVEELANTLTHLLGLVLSFAGFLILVYLASWRGDFWYVLSSLLYGSSLVTLYAASVFYHSAAPALKTRLQIIDHCCIYLLIAGTYTPFTLIVLREGIGQNLFFFVWTFAAFGIFSKIAFGKRFRVASVLSYLVMGWCGIAAIEPLFAALGFGAVALVVAGGLTYSIGVIFFAWKSLRHNHAIWHVFVLAGSILHFLAVALYVLPFQSQVINKSL